MSPPQTRLPGELAMELEGLATEYEADLMFYQQEGTDSETEGDDDNAEPLRPLRNFPAVALITAIHSFLEVCAPCLYEHCGARGPDQLCCLREPPRTVPFRRATPLWSPICPHGCSTHPSGHEDSGCSPSRAVNGRPTLLLLGRAVSSE